MAEHEKTKKKQTERNTKINGDKTEKNWTETTSDDNRTETKGLRVERYKHRERYLGLTEV